MKKTLLTLAVIAGLASASLGLAKTDKEKKFEPLPNLSNVHPLDLKQSISIEETGSGNLAWIKGAKVTEIYYLTGTTSSTFTTTTTAPNMLRVKVFGQEYKIKISGTTNVVRQSWGKSDVNLLEFSIGDIVNAYGTLDSSDPFLILAKTVRNISIQNVHTQMNGKIETIASSTASFTIQAKKNLTVTVNTDSDTKFYKGKDAGSFSDLQVGTQVSVRGLIDKTLAKVKALVVRIKPMEVEQHGQDED